MRARGLLIPLLALVAVVVALSWSRPAHAEELCAGCLLTLPEGDAAVPLLVTLHGDRQPVRTVHDAWRRLAVPRGIAVLSLSCPAALGCAGSFWRWDGDPSFITGEVAKVLARGRIDRERLWLVGWSGGATYLGWRERELAQTFTAFVVHGGGVPPGTAACAGATRPAYFLVGDKNPLHPLAVRLRDHLAACGHELTWDLLPGADHEAEWNALRARGKVVVDWLLAREPQRRDPQR